MNSFRNFKLALDSTIHWFASETDMIRRVARYLAFQSLEQRTMLDGLPVASQLWQQGADGIINERETGDLFGKATAVGDFDHDGFDDLAIGTPGELVGDGRGAVSIIYGSSDRLVSARNQLFTHEVIGTGGDTEFGRALAVGDFDHDGIDDLAVGAPKAVTRSGVAAGAIVVLYGSRLGLSDSNPQILDEDMLAGGRSAAAGDDFGFSLAVSNFDQVQADDIAIGIPQKSIDGNSNAGAVMVIHGGRQNGLDAERSFLLHQGSQHTHGPLKGVLEPGDQFGYSLAVGNFDRDNGTDLAVGSPGETINGSAQAGAVSIVYSTFRAGLGSHKNQFLHRGLDSVDGEAAADDEFGFSLASGDFDSDRYADLAIGAPGQKVGEHEHAGAVHLVHGSFPQMVVEEMWHQDLAGIDENADEDDRFGQALVAGDLQPENQGDELAIAVPKDNAIHVLGHRESRVLYRGYREKVAAPWLFVNSQTIYADMAGISSDDDSYGESLAIGDFDSNDRNDLAIGTPGDRNESGAVSILYPPIDFTAPEVRIERSNCGTLAFDLEFSEHAFGFSAGDLWLTNSSEAQPHNSIKAISTYSCSSIDRPEVTEGVFLTAFFRSTITSGRLSVELPAGVVTNELQNPNVASSTFSLDFVSAPVVIQPTTASISSASEQGVAEINVRFSRTVENFGLDDIVITSDTGFTHAELSGEGRSYLITLTGMTRAGFISVQLLDSATEPLEFDPPPIATFDFELLPDPMPVVSLRSVDARVGIVYFRVDFARPVEGVEASDFHVEGSSGASKVGGFVEDSPGIYVVSVSDMTQDGLVTLTVPAGIAIDEDGRPNQQSNTISYEYVDPLFFNRWGNPTNLFDVNDDGVLSPRDILMILLEIREHEYSDRQTGKLERIPLPSEKVFFDVSQDGYVTGRDALLVILEIERIAEELPMAALAAHSLDDDPEDDVELRAKLIAGFN